MNNIKHNSLFINLSEDQIKIIFPKFSIKKFKMRQTIIEENSVGNSICLLLKGSISIEKNLIPVFEGYKSNPDDKKIITVNENQNYFFGEMSLFDPKLKRSASIAALTDVEIAELTDCDFNEIINSRPDIGVILLKNIGLKLSILLEKSNVELSKMITAFAVALKL